MLDHYQAYFTTVEINSTYYRIPHPAVFYNIVKKTKPEFEFIIKTHQTLTHLRQDIEKSSADLLEAVRPIAERGQLKGLLAQFPWSFKFTMRNLQYLQICREMTQPCELYIEFRHSSWLNDRTYDTMKNLGLRYVSVDGPRLQGLLPPELKTIGDIAYIRLHGRNAEKWWDGGSLRYDYNYSRDELEEWKSRIDTLKSEATKKVFIFFNNCHLGQAVKNAREMMRMFDMI